MSDRIDGWVELAERDDVMDNNSATVPSRLLDPFADRLGTGASDALTGCA